MAVTYVVVMIAVIVTVDALIFRNHFWERLMVNIGIVLVCAAFYLRFLSNHRTMFVEIEQCTQCERRLARSVPFDPSQFETDRTLL